MEGFNFMVLWYIQNGIEILTLKQYITRRKMNSPQIHILWVLIAMYFMEKCSHCSFGMFSDIFLLIVFNTMLNRSFLLSDSKSLYVFKTIVKNISGMSSSVVRTVRFFFWSPIYLVSSLNQSEHTKYNLLFLHSHVLQLFSSQIKSR